HLSEDRQVLEIDQIVVELDDVLEATADRGQRMLEVLEGLHRLQPEIAGDLALAVDAELAGDVDDAGGGGRLDHVGVAGRLRQRFGIDETGLAHGVLLRSFPRAILGLFARKVQPPSWLRDPGRRRRGRRFFWVLATTRGTAGGRDPAMKVRIWRRPPG